MSGKVLCRILVTLTLSWLIHGYSIAQRASCSTNGGMTIGFGIGGSYQGSDIANSIGAGFDFWLGSHLFKKEGSLLSADWKFRFLAGENRAYDHRENTDGTFSNVRYGFFSYDLELGLTLNRLRERTRIVLTGFAGAGITHGRTFTDLLDGNGVPYDFSSIDAGASKNQIYSDLLELTDGEFETALVNKAAIMPTAGIYLGYQFSRSFSMGIEHKINFSLSEKNTAFGIDIDNRIKAGSGIDMNHYTLLGFRWNMGGGGAARVPRYTPPPSGIPALPARPATPVTPVAKPVPAPAMPVPVVRITIPGSSPFSTRDESVVVTARVQNINKAEDIRVSLNGMNAGFDFNSAGGTVTFTVNLKEGQNSVVVSASNPSGNARDNLTIIYSKPSGTPPPVITFINPPAPVAVEKNIFPLTVKTEHVKTWNDVEVIINGVPTHNFSLSREGLVTTNVGLREGENRIEVSGTNESGRRSGHTTITFTKVAGANPPVITVLLPASSPHRSRDPFQEVQATVSHVQAREQVTVTLNGTLFDRFEFDSGRSTLRFTAGLREGENVVAISAVNQAGRDEKILVIVREAKPCPAPVVNILEPVQGAGTTNKREISFRAEVKNITGRSDLVLSVNGQNIPGFSFTGNIVQQQIILSEGQNTIKLSAGNNCGSNEAARTITYKPEVPAVTPCMEPSIVQVMNKVPGKEGVYDLKGSTSHVQEKKNISISVNGKREDDFLWDPVTGDLSKGFSFAPGVYAIVTIVRNDCGSDTAATTVTVGKPCIPPKVTFTIREPAKQGEMYELNGKVTNVRNKGEISLRINGKAEPFQFNPSAGSVVKSFRPDPGTYVVSLSARNECGRDSIGKVLSVDKPCVPPEVSFEIIEQDGGTGKYKLSGTVANITGRQEITLTVNGRPETAFEYNSSTESVTSVLLLQPGQNTINITAATPCGKDTKTRTISVSEEKPCGIRINPGNSAWQFCLVTPRGTYNRDHLTDSDFSYSGPASGVYFMPVAGGGDAIVNGRPYSLRSGQYYLFTGRITVSVSTRNPGSMGHWSICITADKEPEYGSGNSRPESPCETEEKGKNR